MEIKKALQILKNEKIKNLSMIYTLENNIESITELKIINNSVMLKKETDNKWVMIHSQNDEDLDLIMKELGPEDKSFNGIYKEVTDKIIEKHPSEVKWSETTYRFYLPEEVQLPDIDTSNIVELEEKDAHIINDYWEYKDENTINYIKSMLTRNPSIGIRENGELISWVSVHDDGALGFMYVMEKYRGLGYAKRLAIQLCNIVRKKGMIPFLYVVIENEKSVNLAKSLGFVEDKLVNWFYMK